MKKANLSGFEFDKDLLVDIIKTLTESDILEMTIVEASPNTYRVIFDVNEQERHRKIKKESVSKTISELSPSSEEAARVRQRFDRVMTDVMSNIRLFKKYGDGVIGLIGDFEPFKSIDTFLQDYLHPDSTIVPYETPLQIYKKIIELGNIEFWDETAKDYYYIRIHGMFEILESEFRTHFDIRPGDYDGDIVDDPYFEVIAELHNVISKLTIEQFRRTMKEGNNV